MLDYAQYVGDNHRKSFGQYFTHPDVAGFMTRWVLDSGKKSLFDPAFGLGAFRKAVPQNSNVTFSACEIDPGIVEFWERHTGERSGFIAGEDYLRSWGKHHANIVCNPPYMRFQKFLNRDIVFKEFQRRLGIRLSGYTNTASAFLLKSLSELRESGRMAYIMPLEFLHAGYGSLVKETLIASGHLCAILRFDCEKDIFPDATTSVGIILYDTAVRHTSVKFYSVQSITQLALFDDMEPVSDVPLAKLDSRSKWLPLFQKQPCATDPTKMTTLDSFGRFSRGIATGANEFFVLRPSAVKHKGLDRESECLPCITRSSQICKPVFDTADYDELSDSDKPVLLFSINGTHSKEAEHYIQFGESRGFSNRFLTTHRKPWYKTEKRNPSRLLLGVFSRGGYKIIFNKSKALNLTCFHGFQPNEFGREYVEHLFLYLSSRTGRDIVALSMRRYGASLDKFEPNDINGSSVPSRTFFASMPAETVSRAVRAISETGHVPQWAEALFTPLTIPDTMAHRMTGSHGNIANVEHGRDIRKENQGLARTMPQEVTKPAR